MPLEEHSRARKMQMPLLDTKHPRSKDWSLMAEFEERKSVKTIKLKDGREHLLPLNNIKNSMMSGFQRDVLPLKNLKQLENNQKLINQLKKLRLRRLLFQQRNKQLRKLRVNQLLNKLKVELKSKQLSQKLNK